MLAVLSSDSDHYRQAFEGFNEEWGSSVPFVLLGQTAPTRPDVIVAFGSLAAIQSRDTAPFLVACLAPGARRQRAGNELQIGLLPSPDRLLQRMHKLLPRMRVLRVIWTSEFQEPDVRELVRAGKSQGIAVQSERIDPVGSLPDRLRGMEDPADAVWLMPDPILVNARNFAVLQQYAAAKKIPLLAPADGLVEKGATATFSTSFRDSGKSAASALREMLTAGRWMEVVHPEALTVTVSAAAARELGFPLTPESQADRVLP